MSGKIKVLMMTTAILFCSCFCMVGTVSAKTICEETGIDDPILCGTKYSNEEAKMQDTVGNVLNAIYGVIEIMAVVFVVVGGIKYSTSQGDPGRVQAAKMTLMCSIIGLVITISAFAITNFILGGLGGTGAAGGGGGGAPGGGGGGSSEEEVVYVDLSGQSSMLIAESQTLTATIVPDYAKDRSLTFSSSDSSVAAVDSNGKVVAKKEGSTTITATASNGVKGTITITVKKPVEAESVTINPNNIKLKVGKSNILNAKVLPSNAKDKKVTWSSSDSSIATVGSNGKVVAKKVGTAQITATTSNGKSAKATVTVEENTAPAPTPTDKLKFGDAIAVLHVDHKYTEQFEKGGQEKMYAAECDVYVTNSTVYCYHAGTGMPSKTQYSLATVMGVAKKYSMKVILDMESDYYKTVANVIKSNGWQNRVIVQINGSNNVNRMNEMNSIVGSKLEFWGLVYLGSASTVYNDIVSNASSYKSAGMTTVNIQHNMASSYANGVSSKGLNVCIFAWGSLRNSYSSYAQYKPTYLMSDESHRYGY